MNKVRYMLAIGLVAVALAGCRTSPHGTRPAADSSAGAQPGTLRVRLTWQTETELNAFGFYVHRADTTDGPMEVINRETPVHAAGTTTIPQRYRYYDLEVEAGKTYYYKLEQVDSDGSSHFIVGADRPVPGEPKPLTEDESAEIRAHGIMYRQEAG